MKEKNLLAELAAYLFSASHGETGRTPSERELAEHFSVSRGQIREALAIPGVKGASDPLDCPLCGSDDRLTPERIAYIAKKLADTDDFRKAENAARTVLSQLENAQD